MPFQARLRRTVLLLAAVVSTTLLLPAASALAEDYVAMGDSYASGTGTREYYDEGCERSNFAYSSLIRGSFGSTFRSVACGGAKVPQVTTQANSLSASTKFVTVSVGGNDAGFSSVITACAQPAIPFTNGCNPDIDKAQEYIAEELPGQLDKLYGTIRAKAPNAVVAVVGYPRLFNGEDCNAGTFFSADEMTRLNQTADLLAGETRARARSAGFTFVDARQAFLGHAVCDDEEWLNGLSNPTGESYHPNKAGHSSGFAPMVRAALSAAAEPDAPAGGVGRVAFSSARTGGGDIYAINGDGQFPVRLTADPAADIDPAWSPDGTKVAFASNRDGDNEIYVMDGDGTAVTKLTNNTSDDREPAWSPSGGLLAFRSNRTGNNEVFRMTATGTGQTNLTDDPASDFAPDWSPDGAELVFQRSAANNEVMKANSSGQGQVNLSANSANDGRPTWSPSGATIAFHSNRGAGDFEILTIGATGGSTTTRTANSSDDTDPAYAPNGASIAFTANRDGNEEIYTMTSTGAGQTRRTTSPGNDTSASWQADSTPPTTTIQSGPSAPVADARPSFTFASSELGSGLQCRIDSAAFANCVSPYQPRAALTEGEHTFSVRSTDPAGNPSAAPTVRTFVVDTIEPVVTAECPPSVLLGSAAVAKIMATDATSGMAAIDDPSGEHELDTSVPGVQRYRAPAIDLAGNDASAECTYEVRYPDPGAPELRDGASPNTGGFGLAWTASAPAADYAIRYVVERRDAAGEWERVRDGLADAATTFSGAGAADEGTWTFRVKGIDSERGVETGWSEPSAPVVVDRTAPRAPKLSAGREPEFVGDGGWFADAVEVSTAADGDPALRDGSAPSGVDAASVADPATLTETTTLRRTVRDRVGNESAATERAFQVDGDAPQLELTCPETVELLAEATFDIAASDEGSGLADDPSGTDAIDTRRAGVKRITRTATDNVGHTTTETCTVLIVYPTPGTPALSEGGSPNDGGFGIAWKASAPAGHPLRYVLQRRDAADGADWELVADDLEDAARAFTARERADEGTWVYRVRGVDAENELDTPWSETSEPVVVDRTGPRAPKLTADRDPEFGGDGGWWKGSVTVRTTDDGDPDLRDGSPPSGVDASSVALPATLDATATVRRTVRDRAGNESAATSERFQVDTDAPQLELTCPDTVELLGDAEVEVAASDAGSGLAEDPSGTVVVDTARAGRKTITRTATDNVGHATTESCSVLVVYPTPGVPALSEGGSPNGGDFTLTWKASTPAGEDHPLRYVLQRRDASEDAAWETVAGDLRDATHSFTKGEQADEGTWTFRVRGIDSENDLETAWSDDSAEVAVDRTGPRAPGVAAGRDPEFGGDGGWWKGSVTVRTTDNGDPDLRDGSTPSGVDPSSVAGAQTLTATATVRRTVLDRVGNESAETSERFQIDTDAPQLELACPETVELLADATFEIAASDVGSGLADDPSGTEAIDTARAGRKTITRTATDNVGHTTTETCSILVVYPTPGAPALNDGGSPNAGDFAVAWKASAPAGHPLRYVLQRRDAANGSDWDRVDGGLEDAAYAFTDGEQADEGTWVYRVRGVDSENDLETPWSETSEPVVVDQTGPRAPKMSADRDPEYAGDGGWFADTVDVTTADAGDPQLRDGSDPSGVDASSVAGVVTLTESTTLRRTVLDTVGNESAETSKRFQVDTDDPELALTCPDAVELLSDTTVDVAASDARSGLAKDPSGTVDVDTSSVGTKRIERTATDNVGHSTTASCAVLVEYPTPGAPAVINGDNPNAGAFTLGWKASAPAGYPLRYVLERRDADDTEWQQVRDGLEPADFAFRAGDRADEGTWTYRVRGVDEENGVQTPWSAVSAPVKVDQTAPAAPTLTPGRAAEFGGDGGWWKDQVTVTTTANGDPDLRDGSAPSGVDASSIAAPVTLDETGTPRETVSDRVGNVSDATERTFQVDTRRPELRIDCPTSVLLRGEGVVKVAASDDQSGLDRDPTATLRIDTSEVGTQVFERTATDNVGHVRTVRCEVLVRYGYAGLLQPVNRDGSSIFKLGSTVPLKLLLTDADGASVTSAVVKVELEKITSSIDGERVEETVLATPTNGKTFTYSGGHYGFNLSTKPLSAGTWRVLLTFDDGTQHRTKISLR